MKGPNCGPKAQGSTILKFKIPKILNIRNSDLKTLNLGPHCGHAAGIEELNFYLSLFNCICLFLQPERQPNKTERVLDINT